MPDSCLYITFTESQDVYFPGSVIEGIAHLVLNEPIKARTLTVGLDCRAHTSYDVSRSRTVTKSSSENYTESYSATTVYANVETIVWTSPPDGKEVMPAGTYQYPFAFKLPLDLPPSFEGSYGYIRHMVKMELDRPWRFNKRDKKAFT
ncbi:arrestin domain protein, partial [Necator americanus]